MFMLLQCANGQCMPFSAFSLQSGASTQTSTPATKQIDRTLCLKVHSAGVYVTCICVRVCVCVRVRVRMSTNVRI